MTVDKIKDIKNDGKIKDIRNDDTRREIKEDKSKSEEGSVKKKFDEGKVGAQDNNSNEPNVSSNSNEISELNKSEKAEKFEKFEKFNKSQDENIEDKTDRMSDEDYIDIAVGRKKFINKNVDDNEQSSIFDVIFSVNFLPYMISQFFGAINHNIIRSTTIMYILYTSDIGSLMILMVNAIFIFPSLLFSFLAGRIGLYFDYTRIAQVVKSMELLTVLLNIYALYTDSIVLMCVSVFLIGVDMVFFGAVKLAIPTCLLPSKYFNLCNSFVESSTYIGILVGTILGGFMFLDNALGFYIKCLSIVIAVLGFVISLFIPKSNNDISNDALSIAIYDKSDKDIFCYVYNRLVLFYTALATSWFWMLGNIVMSLIPVLSKNIMNCGVEITNVFLCVFSIGIVIGSYFVHLVLHTEITLKYCILALLGVSFCSLDLYFAVPLVISNANISIVEFLSIPLNLRILFDLLLLCIFLSIFVIPVFSLLQLAVTGNRNCNRIFAVVNLYHAFFMIFSTLSLSVLFVIGLSVSKILLVLAVVNILVIMTAYYAIPNSRLIPLSIWRLILRFCLSRLYTIDVQEIKHYQEGGDKLIIIANHVSYFDAFIIAAFIPADRICFAVDDGIYKKYFWGPIKNIINVLPVNILDVFSVRNMIAKVKGGEVLVIFPEGRVSQTGVVMKIQEGAGLIAYRSGANILPVFLDWHKGGGIFSTVITMQLFPLIRFDVDPDISIKARREKIAKKIYDHMLYMRYKTNNKPVSVYSDLLNAAKRNGANSVVMFNDINCFNNLTYNDLILKSIVLSRVLKEEYMLGILLPTVMATPVLFYAMQLRNITPVMLNFSLGGQVVLNAIKSLHLKTVYSSQEFINKASLSNMIDLLRKNNVEVILLEHLRDKEITIFNKVTSYFYSFFHSYYYGRVSPNVDVNDTAVILFTSGSTASPKAVCLSHKNLYSNLSQSLAGIDITSKDTMMHALPLFHSFGLMSLLVGVRTGAKVFLYPSPIDYKIIPQIFYEISGTIMFSTNKFLECYAKYAHDYDFFSAKYIFAGAEKLQENVSKGWFEKFGIRILQGYGATEASPVISINTHLLYKKNTVGKIIPGIQFKLKQVEGMRGDLDSAEHVVDGLKLKVKSRDEYNIFSDRNSNGSIGRSVIKESHKMDKVGELCIKGDNIMKGYLDFNSLENVSYNAGDIAGINGDSSINNVHNIDGNDNANSGKVSSGKVSSDISINSDMQLSQKFAVMRRAWRYYGVESKGWYNTGDIVKLDDDGYITIVGRTKRFIKVAGEMLALDAIEVFYKKVLHAYDCAVLDHIVNGEEKFVLFTTFKEFDIIQANELIRDNYVSMLYSPFKIVYVDEIPLFVSGKINYNLLREKYCK